MRFRLALLAMCASALSAACLGEETPEAPLRRSELTIYPTSRWPRERLAVPGEWMLISSQRGLWVPHTFAGWHNLVFRKRGPEVFVSREGSKEELVGVRLGSLDGRLELRGAVAAGASPLTIWCYPSDIEDIPPLPAGRHYALAVEGVNDLVPIAKLRHLSALKVGCSRSVGDLSPLAALPGLESLWLSGASASDLKPLTALSKLKVLRIDFCREIADLSPLAEMKSLRVLELDGAERLADLSPLAKLSRLSILVLRRCPGILDLAPVAQLRSLTWLGVHGCPLVSDLEPLRGLPQLAAVEIEGATALRDLRPLATIQSLETVALENCPELSDISPLATLSRLSRLDVLDCPRVSDLWPMRRAARQPERFSVDWRMRDHLAALRGTAPGRVTLLMDGRYVSSVGLPPEALDEGDGWGSILGRAVVPAPGLGLPGGHLPYPAFLHKPGEVVNFALEGPRVYRLKDRGPRQLVGVIACSRMGREALKEAIAEGVSPLIIWADAASVESLPPLPEGRDYTLALVGLRPSIEGLERVRNLTGLYAPRSCTPESSLWAIARLTGLKVLCLRGSPAVNSWRYLSRMTQLTSLDIALSPRIRDLAPLAQLRELEALRLACPRQVDFAPLAALPNLTQLSLELGEGCTDLSSLGKLSNLRMLSLRTRTSPKSLDFLARLPRLSAVRLAEIPSLADLEPLATLSELEVVILRNCYRLRDLAVLSGLKALRHLDIAACDKAGDVLTLERLRRRGVQLALDSRLLGLMPRPPRGDGPRAALPGAAAPIP